MAQSKTWRRNLALLLFAALPWTSAFAQNYAITESVIASGGGTSTNGTFAITGTIGQPEAGEKMSGGNFSVEGGFWQAITLVQTPGTPLLLITRNGTQATLHWDLEESGFILEFATSLTAPVNWQPVSGVVNNSVGVSSTTGAKFFRLRMAP